MLGDKAYDSADLRQRLKGARHQAGHSQQVEPKAALQLRQENLQATTPHRECLLQAQDFRRVSQPVTTGWPETSSPQSASSLLSYGGFYESGP